MAFELRFLLAKTPSRRYQMPTQVGERRSEIEQQLRDALDGAPGLSALRIAISVEGTCATLCGMVWTREQRDQAEALARATPGVSTVKNYLSINLFQ
jgi:osmotically-inducible protein OsmY